MKTNYPGSDMGKKRPPQGVAGAYHLTYILYCSIRFLNILQGLLSHSFKTVALKYLLYLRLAPITEV
jgi:hypothetical protein